MKLYLVSSVKAPGVILKQIFIDARKLVVFVLSLYGIRVENMNQEQSGFCRELYSWCEGADYGETYLNSLYHIEVIEGSVSRDGEEWTEEGNL